MFVESFGINSFIQNETILPCLFEDSPFVDPKHGHILTEDLRVVLNNKLIKLIT